MKKILLLGSGELGKEVVIALKRLGHYVVAADHYAGAPAMQISDSSEVLDMLDGDALDRLVKKVQPDLIVPEVEAIRTERFYGYEQLGIQVVPSAKAANYTMNRKLIRDLAARELGLRTAPYRYAMSEDEFRKAIGEIGLPCVVKPLMSSSGKGQSVVRSESDITSAWNYAMQGSRGDVKEVIVEGFIDFHTEITLLTVTQQSLPTLFCPPIGHRQERGDYQESWQPCAISDKDFVEACQMADSVTAALGGAGIWGVEFFLTDQGVYFSELSPRPHDTGMVTLSGSQNLNEFELHARAILGLPILSVDLRAAGVSAVILSQEDGAGYPKYSGIEQALSHPGSDVKIFGKPSLRKYRRMGVALVNEHIGCDMQDLRDRARKVAEAIQVSSS